MDTYIYMNIYRQNTHLQKKKKLSEIQIHSNTRTHTMKKINQLSKTN